MRRIFADTFFWVAVANPEDSWHAGAKAIWRSGKPVPLLTTDEVLVEVLTYFRDHGNLFRAKAARMIRSVLASAKVEVVPQTHSSFIEGLAFYESRPDKEYSLTDCISMNTMRKHGLTDALTYDHHFIQEGFRALFRT